MKKQILAIIGVLCLVIQITAQTNKTMKQDFKRHKLASRIDGLNLSLLHLEPNQKSLKKKTPVLFIHGASFPSALAFGFRMNDKSWMDVLSDQGFDVYALDFLGYGESDRYPEMRRAPDNQSPLGASEQVIPDVEKAVAFILARTGAFKVNLIGHSWGATVCAKYAGKYSDKIENLVLFGVFVERENDPEMTEKPTSSYSCLTPQQRLKQFKSRTPDKNTIVLEDDVVKYWGAKWLQSDSKSKKQDEKTVCFPSGWHLDLYHTYHGSANYNPAKIINRVLLIRGEWDDTPSFNDAEKLYKNLSNALVKRYVVIDKSTHVMHLEKNRFQLYAEVSSFLNEER